MLNPKTPNVDVWVGDAAVQQCEEEFTGWDHYVRWVQGPRQWARGSNGVPPLGVEIHEKATYWLLII